MNSCPHCKSSLGELEAVMDTLSENKINGEVEFDAPCCGEPLKAYAQAMAYYLVPVKDIESGAPQRIGHA